MEKMGYVVLFAFACLFASFPSYELYLHLRWQESPGKILHSRVEEAGGKFRPLIRYEYTAQGKTLQAEGLESFFATVDRDRGAIERLVRQYPPGSTVPVYYDPAAPERAALRMPVHWGLFVAAILLAAFGVANLIWRSRPVRRGSFLAEPENRS